MLKETGKRKEKHSFEETHQKRQKAISSPMVAVPPSVLELHARKFQACTYCMHSVLLPYFFHSPCQPNRHAGSQTPHFAGHEATGEPTWNMADVFKGKGVEGFKERSEAAANAKLALPDSNKYSQAISNPIVCA